MAGGTLLPLLRAVAAQEYSRLPLGAIRTVQPLEEKRMNGLNGYEVRRAFPHFWLVAKTVRSFFPAKFRGLSIDNPWGVIMRKSLRSALCGAVALLVWAAGTTPALATATCGINENYFSSVSQSDPLRVSCTLWGTASADMMTGEMLVSKTPPWAFGDAIAGLSDQLEHVGSPGDQ